MTQDISQVSPCWLIWAACFRLESIFRTLSIRFRYGYVLHRIRGHQAGQKIRVVFLVNETSKWKTQSLYDLMEKSGKYEPIIALTLADIDWALDYIAQRDKYEANRKFFESRGMRVKDAFDWRTRTPIDILSFEADIVWYQQPWNYSEWQRPGYASLTALTCYVPYFVANYGDFEMDYGKAFHKELWRYFILNKDWERLYRKRCHFWSHAGKILGLGHTGLDYLSVSEDRFAGDYVIYAPHWSFDHPGNVNVESYSTFLHTGLPILKYAQKHPQIKWVFKPHPSLRMALERSGAWSKEDVDAYYRAWEKIGVVCQTGDYQQLFLESRAMITDCGSFLTEYFVTGKPLIHLISHNAKLKPLKPSQRMFKSFYRVHDLDELERSLDAIVVSGEDPRQPERIALLRDSGLNGGCAAERILCYLDKTLRI